MPVIFARTSPYILSYCEAPYLTSLTIPRQLRSDRHKKTGGHRSTGLDHWAVSLLLNTHATFEPGFKFFTQAVMANTIFDECLHITELIPAVMALTFHMVGFHGLFLDQHIDSRAQISALST